MYIHGSLSGLPAIVRIQDDLSGRRRRKPESSDQSDYQDDAEHEANHQMLCRLGALLSPERILKLDRFLSATGPVDDFRVTTLSEVSH